MSWRNVGPDWRAKYFDQASETKNVENNLLCTKQDRKAAFIHQIGKSVICQAG
jgi:hypothetical protein